MPDQVKPFEAMGAALGKLTQEKNEAYGDSFAKAGEILELLFPTGIQPSQYRDALGIVRVVDKLFRIATRKDAFGESPWRDIAGYGILGAVSDDVVPEEAEEPEPVTQATPKSEPAPATKFKVGDRVRVVDTSNYFFGRYGVVTDLHLTCVEGLPYRVRLDGDDTREAYELWFSSDGLAPPAAWQPKPGDRVRLIPPSGWAGSEATVVELFHDGRWVHLKIDENIGFTCATSWTEPV